MAHAARMAEPISWTDFARRSPELARMGRSMFYEFDVGLGFLATVRSDGGPRVHPVCPIFVAERLFLREGSDDLESDRLGRVHRRPMRRGGQ